jgi:hypothetical protein
MTPLLVQVVRLAKSILLQPVGSPKTMFAKFFAGKHDPFIFPGGTCLTWWYSADRIHALDTVVALVIKDFPNFRDCDPETVSEVVTKTLQEVCVNPAIFNVDAVFLARSQTLFDCCSVPVPTFSQAIIDAIEANLRVLICRLCTLYAVPRFMVKSFLLDEDSIHIIAKADGTAWQRLVDRKYEFQGWSPERPVFGAREDKLFSPQFNFECVFVAEEYGTQKGTCFNSILKFRRLTAVLFAVASSGALYPYRRSTAPSSKFCMQFPHSSDCAATISRIDCEALVPSYGMNVPIGPDEAMVTQNWYRTCARCSPGDQRRLEKGAHFLNRAMNSDDIESYVNYFVTLDALFGQRGAVETSILAGIKSLGIDPKFTEKTPWLFDLRNEIVHGGSRYVAEWPKYARYSQHFRTRPLEDIRALAQFAVLHAPRAFA